MPQLDPFDEDFLSQRGSLRPDAEPSSETPDDFDRHFSSVRDDDFDRQFLAETKEKPWHSLSPGNLSHIPAATSESFKQFFRGESIRSVDKIPETKNEFINWSADMITGANTDPEMDSSRLLHKARSDIAKEYEGFTDDDIKNLKADLLQKEIDKFSRGEKRIQDLTPEDMSTLERGISSGFISVGNMLPGLAASLATRNPAFMVGSGVLQTRGQAYGSARSEGLSVEDATRYGNIDGAIEGITEAIPGGKLVKLFGGKLAKQKVTKETLKFLISDMAGEQVATFTQSLNAEWHDLDKELDQHEQGSPEWWAVHKERSAVTALATLVGAGSQAGIAHGAGYAANKMAGQDVPTLTDMVAPIQEASTIDGAIDAANQAVNDSIASLEIEEINLSRAPLPGQDVEEINLLDTRLPGQEDIDLGVTPLPGAENINLAATPLPGQTVEDITIDRLPGFEGALDLDRPQLEEITPAQIRSQEARERAHRAAKINPDKDELLTAIAKLGGIQRSEAEAQGIDSAEFSRRSGIKPVFKVKGGMTLDQMAESLSQDGYISKDYTANELLEKVGKSLAGENQFTPEGYARQAEIDHYENMPAEDLNPTQEDLSIGEVYGNAMGRGIPSEDVESIMNGAPDLATAKQELDAYEIQPWTNETVSQRPPEEKIQAGADISDFSDAEIDHLFAGRPAEEIISERFDLAQQTEAGAQAQQQALDSEKQANIRHQQRIKADDSRDSFVLEGSSAEADKAAARGQKNLLEAKQGEYSQELGFFSGLSRAAENLKQESGAGQQMLNTIKKQPGVKAEELEHTGLEEFLTAKQRSGEKATKQEIQDFVGSNGVVVEEVVKQGSRSRRDLEAIKKDPFTFDVVDGDGAVLLESVSQASADDFIDRQYDGDSTKFKEYQFPGGENYREVLLKLPSKKKTLEQWKVLRPDGISDGLWVSKEAAEARADQIGGSVEGQKESIRYDAGFKSSHFDELNIIAHARLNDRVGPDGEKVLFIEEIQSDWHQAGRKEGYGPQKSLSETDEIINGVPDAPFKGNAWTELAIKRILRMASEGGYDSVSWTTGDMQADRYDLSKQLAEVKIFNHGDGNWDVSGRTSDTGELVDFASSISEDKLQETVGKDLADRAIRNQKERGWATYEGDDLKVGGEGMRGFYDKALPNIVKKVARKLDKSATVTTIKIKSEGRPTEYADFDAYQKATSEGAEVWNIKLSDVATDSALQGQSLFQKQSSYSPEQAYTELYGQEPSESSESQDGSKDPISLRAGRIQASAHPRGFNAEGKAQLIGKKISSPEELADAAQIYRNPEYETFRIFFTKGDEIVAQTGISARLPGQTSAFKGANEEGYAHYKSIMSNSEADGYYLLHNHPQGDPSPSTADLRTTEQFAHHLPGLKQHIIINNQKYGVIDIKSMVRGNVATEEVKTRHFPLTYNSTDFSKPHQVIGEKLSSPMTAAKIAKEVQQNPNHAVLIGYGKSGVRGAMDIPLNMIDKPAKFAAYVRRFGRHIGSQQIILANIPESYSAKSFEADQALSSGLLSDVLIGGKSKLFELGTGARNPDFAFGKELSKQERYLESEKGEYQSDDYSLGGRVEYKPTGSLPLGSVDAYIDGERFGRWPNIVSAYEDMKDHPSIRKATSGKGEAFNKWFGASKVVDKNNKPLVVYHGSPVDFSEFDPSKLGGGHDQEGAGFYFTSDKTEASGYAKGTQRQTPESKTDGPTVEAYLKIENPVPLEGKVKRGEVSKMVLKANGFNSKQKMLNAFEEDMDLFWDSPLSNWSEDPGTAFSEQVDAIVTGTENPHDAFQQIWYDVFGADNAAYMKAMLELGYDGVILKSETKHSGNDHYIVFNPSSIKSVENKGAFDPKNPNIFMAEQGEYREDGFKDWVAPNAALGIISDELRSKEGIKQRLRHTRKKMQDKHIAWQEVQKAIESHGGSVSDAADAYNKFTLVEGKVGDKFRYIFDKHVKPLVDAIAKSDVTIEQLGDYLYAKFAPQRNARIAEINPEFLDGGSGITNAQAQSILNRFSAEETRTLESMAQRVYALEKYKLDQLVETGRITKELRDTLLKDDRYVPLKGFADPSVLISDSAGTGRGFDQAQDAFKKAKGRGSLAAEIVSTALRDVEAAIISGEKNRVGQSVLRLALENPNKNLWEVNPIKTQRAFNSRTGQVEQRIVQDYKALARDPNVFITWVKGRPYAIEFKDNPAGESALARAVKNMGIDNVPWYVEHLAGLNRYLSYMNTALSPEFILTNPVRDVQTALMKTYGDYDAKTAGKVGKNLPRGFRAATHHLTESKLGESVAKALKVTETEKKYAAEYAAEGGKTDYFRTKTVNQMKSELETELLAASKGAKGAGFRAYRLLSHGIENGNAVLENATRLSLYITLRESGKSKHQAAKAAKNLTVNFNRKGEAGVLVNSLYLFYNASMQGTHLTLKLMKNPKVQKMMVGAASAVAVLTQYNILAGGDDEDGESNYFKISDYEKERNLIFMWPDGSGRYSKIPLPYGLNVPLNAGAALTHVANGKEPMSEAVWLASNAWNSFSPVGESGWNIAAPTVADPFVDIAFNRNFAGSRIMPSENPYEKSPTPDSQKAFHSTPEKYKKAAVLINDLTGGNEQIGGYVDVSPESIQHMVTTYTGAVGGFINRVANSIADPEMPMSRQPFIRKVFGEKSPYVVGDNYRDNTQHIYYLKERDDYLDSQRDKSPGDKEAYFEWKKNNADGLSLIRDLDLYEKEIRALYKERKAARSDGDTEEEERLNEDIAREQAAFNKLYNEIYLKKGIGPLLKLD